MAKSKIEELQAKLREREGELEKKDGELKDNAREMEGIRAELASRKSQLEKTSEMLRKANAEKAAARSEQALLAEKVKRAEQESNAVVREGRREAEAEARARAKAAAEALALRRLADVETRLKGALAQREEVEAQLQRRTLELQDLSIAREEEKEALAEAQRRAAELKENHERAATHAATMRESLASVLEREAELERKLAEAQDNLSISESSMARLRAAHDADEASVHQAKEALEALEKTRAQEVVFAKASEVAAKQLLAEVEQLETELIEKRTALTDLEALVAEQREQLEGARETLAAVQAQAEEARELRDQLQVALDAAQEELEAARAAMKRMQAQLDERMRWIESLETTERLHREQLLKLFHTAEAVRAEAALAVAEAQGGADDRVEVKDGSATESAPNRASTQRATATKHMRDAATSTVQGVSDSEDDATAQEYSGCRHASDRGVRAKTTAGRVDNKLSMHKAVQDVELESLRDDDVQAVNDGGDRRSSALHAPALNSEQEEDAGAFCEVGQMHHREPSNLIHRVAEAAEVAGTARAEAEGLRVQLTAVQEEKAKLTKQLRQRANKLKSLREQLEAANTEVVRLEGDLASTAAKIAADDNKAHVAARRAEEALEEARAALAEREKEVELLKEMVRAARGDAKTKETQIQTLRKKVRLAASNTGTGHGRNGAPNMMQVLR